MRFIFPVILFILAVASFVMFTNPAYQDVKALKAEASDFNQALSNSQELQKERDTLNQKYRSFTPDSLQRLTELLPDSADNIRLILDLQRMAQSYGMSIASIKFDSKQASDPMATTGAFAAASPTDLAQATKDYGIFRMEFSTTATYENFLKFIKDVESSLRLSDIESITFSSDEAGKNTYVYTVKLKTYWLKR